MIKTVKPSDLFVGDILANEPDVHCTDVYVDHEGVWVEWSDGAQGFQERPVKIIRNQQH
jgi:hypothetical protein